MKLIIDIPEDTYYDMKAHEEQVRLCDNKFKTAVLDGTPLAEVIEGIKTEIGARVFDIQVTSDKYFDGVDDVMDIVDSVIDKHISEKENTDADSN